MKLSPEEVARLVSMRARIILTVEEFTRSKKGFDEAVTALKKLHVINEEWMILFAAHSHRIGEHVSDGRFKVFSFFAAGKKLAGVNKEICRILYDKDTLTAMKVLFEHSPVKGLSAPVKYNTVLHTGGNHVQTIDHQKYVGVVKTEHGVTYSIEFADQTTLSWNPQDPTVDMAKVKQLYEDKLRDLTPAPQVRLGQ